MYISRAKIGNRNCTNFSDSIVQHRTNVSNEALNGRKLEITLPEVSPTPNIKHTLWETQKTTAERDAEQKSNIKAYADWKLGTKPSNTRRYSACETNKEKQIKHSF